MAVLVDVAVALGDVVAALGMVVLVDVAVALVVVVA